MLGLHKIPHPENFEFLGAAEPSQSGVWSRGRHSRSLVTDLGDDVFWLRWSAPGKSHAAPRSGLFEPRFRGAQASEYSLELQPGGGFALRLRGRPRQAPLLTGLDGGTFGLLGATWMLRFVSQPSDRFFGMGEKWGSLEKSGLKSQFWNTDVWADYAPQQIGEAHVDAAYASIPYLVLERQGTFVGLLLDSPGRAFMATNPVLSLTGADPFADSEANVGEATRQRRTRQQPGPGQLYLGAMSGAPSVYVLVGPSLADLTQKLQRLVGTTPRPPLWALGHQQSRWGYGDYGDLLRLDQGFAESRIPCDGLWLDIDYMDGFRVFTTRPGAFPPAAGGASFAELAARRRRVVAILDPGVKVEPGYRIYEEGLRGGHFCLSPSGRPYVGVVWPGQVHFPDFSRAETRDFWAREVERLAHQGFSGFWIDMNDPSTGPVEQDSMLFAGGTRAHEWFHNEYALGMAIATRLGLSRARPEERPFVLTRSASTGIASHAAVWTGDNVSSFRHLQASIPTSINLALSGVPFNGPDVPGFGGDASDELAIRFYQATFLFPFLRNHSVKGSRPQEPWAFSPQTTRLLRHYIRLRYRFLPYLYQLFVAQERNGAPILAPAFLDETSQPDWHRREDQFRVGSLLCAPVVEEGKRERELRLPHGHWYCLSTGCWEKGGRLIQRRVPMGETPLFVRSGTILPLAPETAVLAPDGGAPASRELLRRVDFHVFVRPGESARLEYVQDDGETLDYQKGAERRILATAQAGRGRIALEIELLSDAARRPRRPPIEPLEARFIVHGAGKLSARGADGAPLQKGRERFTGSQLAVQRSGRFSV